MEPYKNPNLGSLPKNKKPSKAKTSKRKLNLNQSSNFVQLSDSPSTIKSVRSSSTLQDHASTSTHPSSVINATDKISESQSNVHLKDEKNPKTEVTSPSDRATARHATEKIKESKSIPTKEEPLLQNTRALMKNALTYELETFKENILIIFNHEDIDGFKPRLGTNKDVEALTKTFKNFGFTIDDCKDYTKEQIFEKLKQFTNRNNDLSKYGCVAVAVLTHGSDNGFLRAKDMSYSETEIFNYCKIQNNQTLVTKPKVIIIQACRGEQLSTGAEVNCAGNTFKDVDTPESYVLPRESDMLILYSCYAGNTSHRNTSDGSWFIQELCKKIDDLALTQDLESIMIAVKKEVAIHKYYTEYNTQTQELYTSKQMPVHTSTLIRKLYLRRFGEAPPLMEPYIEGQVNISSEIHNNLSDYAVTSSAQAFYLEPSLNFPRLHANFMKKCLEVYQEENPQEEGIYLLDAANSSTDEIKTANAILNYLTENSKDCNCFKEIKLLKM